MIRFSLQCASGHGFDSWFKGEAGFSALVAAGHLACPVCGSTEVAKSLMAPVVRPSRKGEAAPPARPGPVLSEPQSDLEAAIAALRRQIEDNSEYVGMNFATEARRMHAGETPERAIHGETRAEEARALIDEGLPVAPLPFLPARKVN
jgi:hypothetical protein